MPVTATEFRRIALGLPEAAESAHMNHPDFRLRGKVFATLDYPEKGWGMVKLLPEQQDHFLREQPKAFIPCKGAWGRQGATHVRLKALGKALAKQALDAAWRNVAPKRLLEDFDAG